MSRLILVPEPVSLVRRIPIFDEPRGIRVTGSSRTVRWRIGASKAPRAKRSYVYARRQRPFQTHCKSGHELVDPNLYYPKSGRRKRECRACGRNRALKYKAKVAQRDTN